MNFAEIETLRTNLEISLPTVFGKTKLFKIAGFYSSLLETNDSKLIMAYALEFNEEFIKELKLFSPFYLIPQKTEWLLDQLTEIKSIPILSEFKKEYDGIIFVIQKYLEELRTVLNGQATKSKTHSLTFPLLEISEDKTAKEIFGTLESVSIKINKSKKQNRFVFVPSDKNIDEHLLKQTKISHELSLKYFESQSIKITNNHEFLIYFENLSGNYAGTSLGIALTIGFIEQLSLLYNLPFVTNIKENIATTGGVDETGKITSVSNEIIEKKIDIVFYSNIESFVIPKEDENIAVKKCKHLMAKFPKRKLNLIAISELGELLNRRDLVDITKQPTIIRTAKSVKKHWQSFTITILFILLLFILFNAIKDYDTNPSNIWFSGDTFFIANNHKKIVFKISGQSISSGTPFECFIRLIDINNDKRNEIITSKYSDVTQKGIMGKIYCIGADEKIIWQYEFKDLVHSKRELLTLPYELSIVDTITIDKKKCLMLIANNLESYAGALFSIDIKTGKRVGPTFWNAGHIVSGIISNTESHRELVTLTVNNGYNSFVLLKIPYNKMAGQSLSSEDYEFIGINKVEYIQAVQFHNTDLTKYANLRFSNISLGSLQYLNDEKCYRLVSREGPEANGGIIYKFEKDLSCRDVFIQDSFRMQRDLLVKQGKLNPPFTDTREYKKTIKDAISYWNGNKFVRQKGE